MSARFADPIYPLYPRRAATSTRLWIFPRQFSDKDDVIELIGKVENALRRKSKSIVVYRKETEFNNKGGSAGAILLREHYINYPQK